MGPNIFRIDLVKLGKSFIKLSQAFSAPSKFTTPLLHCWLISSSFIPRYFMLRFSYFFLEPLSYDVNDVVGLGTAEERDGTAYVLGLLAW